MHSTKIQFELFMIKEDTKFYLALLKDPRENRRHGIIQLGLMPYLSLYVYESYKHIARLSPSHSSVLKRDYLDIITASRNRLKLLDSVSRSGIKNYIMLFARLIEAHETFYLSSRYKFLRLVKGIAQKDLGLYVCNRKFIYSSHIAHLNTGLIDQNNAAYYNPLNISINHIMRSVGYDVGEYVAKMAALLNITSKPHECYENQIGKHAIENHDVKSKKFYKHIFEGGLADPAVVFIVFNTLCTLNFIDAVFGQKTPGMPFTVFKIKFITLFHVINSLKRLLNYCYSSGLQPGFLYQICAEVLSNKQINTFMNLRRLRNIIVHYETRNCIVNSSTDVNNAIEGIAEGMPFQKIVTLTDVIYIALSTYLNGLVTEKYNRL